MASVILLIMVFPGWKSRSAMQPVNRNYWLISLHKCFSYIHDDKNVTKNTQRRVKRWQWCRPMDGRTLCLPPVPWGWWIGSKPMTTFYCCNLYITWHSTNKKYSITSLAKREFVFESTSTACRRSFWTGYNQYRRNYNWQKVLFLRCP